MERADNRRQENIRKSLNLEEQLTLMKFRTLMQQERCSLRPMAKLIGISHYALSYIISGKRLPKASTVRLIAEFLDSGLFPYSTDRQATPRRKVSFATESLYQTQRCPFCGSEHNKLQFRTDGDDIVYWVTCVSCHARGPKSKERTQATEKWSRRSAEVHPDDQGTVVPNSQGYALLLENNAK